MATNFQSRGLPDQHSRVPLRYNQKHSPRDFPLPPAGNQSLDPVMPKTPPQVSSKGLPEARSPTFPVTSRWEPTFSPGASRISTPGFPCGNTRSTVPEISRYLMPETKVWIRMPKTPPQISKKESPKQDPRHFPLPPAGQTMQVIPVFPMPDLTPPQVSSKGVPEARSPTFPVTLRSEDQMASGAPVPSQILGNPPSPDARKVSPAHCEGEACAPWPGVISGFDPIASDHLRACISEGTGYIRVPYPCATSASALPYPLLNLGPQDLLVGDLEVCIPRFPVTSRW
jgi:hypothetical protein